MSTNQNDIKEFKSVILLSGGLDSIVSLGLTKEKYNIELALTFDYGQKAFNAEKIASKEICSYYGVIHKIIELNWLKEVTTTALVSDKEIPADGKISFESKSAVWVPNRNGVFLNIAACFADAQGFSYIIIGANREEAQTFSDNTKEFISRSNSVFEYSTEKRPKVLAPLIDFDKAEIVRHALDEKIPLEMVKSCYSGGEKNCGKCESCRRLRLALEKNNLTHFIKKLF